MKTLKILTLLATISFFTSIPSSSEAKDCSNLKTFSHKWNMCKLGSTKYDDVVTKKKKKVKKVKVKKEKPRTLVDLLRKINPNEKKN